jgi:photosystem II stability/assembly factor-like uncharacterized protein
MADPTSRLWIATRKGLFAAERGAQGWQLQEAPSFLGEPVTMVLPDPRDGRLYAALRLGHFGVKLHRSADQGRSWEEIAAPAYPPKPEDAPGAEPDKTPWSTDLIWSLVPGGPAQPGRLWAGTIPGGLFRSDDHGAHWSLVESLWQRPERAKWFGGGYDHAGIHSICIDPRDPRRLVVAVSCGGVWGSEDEGAHWTLLGEGLRADYMPPEGQDDLAVQDPHLMVRCAGAPDTLWIQHHNGVFVSRDGGRQWSAVKGIQPSDFGFAVAVHPGDPLTAWFAPAVKDQLRVPVDARLVVTRTRDGGRSFEALGNGLPVPSWDLVYRHGLVVDGSGKVLALASTTGGLWVSEDGGDRWQEVSHHLPPVYALRFG